MKKLLLLFVGLFLFTATMDAQFRFGAGAQLMFEGSTFGLQGKALYNINETIDAAGTFTFHLEDGIDWTLDLDAHYLLLEIGQDIGFKPFAGLSILRWGAFGFSDTDIGINVGAFFDVLRSGDMQFYVEPKYRIGDFDSLVISGGVLF